MASRHEGDHQFLGHVSAASMTVPSGSVTNSSISAVADIERSKLDQDVLKPYPVPSTSWRVWNALNTPLPATSSSDDLGLYPGTWGTTPWLIRSADVKTTTVTLYSACEIVLPAEYDDGETVNIRLNAGFITTIPDGAATVDVEAYEKAGTGAALSADLCTTAATDFKSLTFANKDFNITATGLEAGSVLQVRIAMSIIDTATATAVIGAIEQVSLLCDIRG
jgi:hypothetical protein